MKVIFRTILQLIVLSGFAVCSIGSTADGIIYPAGKVGVNTAIGGPNSGKMFARVCWEQPTPRKPGARVKLKDTLTCVWVPWERYKVITGGLPDMSDKGELPGKISSAQAGFLASAAVGGPSG